jgi:predicted unusual protein kinase regulating ubiquinone biosynthesis (AarF/ABC1/UbiB family)
MFQWLSYAWDYTILFTCLNRCYLEYQGGRIQLNELVDILVPRIANCGSVAIKFCQWITPKMELLTLDEKQLYDATYEKPRWLNKLEVFLEDCPEHPLSYTLQHYEETHGEKLTERYDIIHTIGSGSIGQVYLLEEKGTGKKRILKIQHPDISYQISYFQNAYTLISHLPQFQDILRKIPFSIHDFIESFREQSDFVGEANNLLRMKDMYADNDMILIPELISVSKTILIMDYLEGKSFDDLEISDTQKLKAYAIFYLFTRNNMLIENFNHGDLHQGNWKITHDLRLIIYDFGFCWSIPQDNIGIIEKALDAFEGTSREGYDKQLMDIAELMFELLVHNSSPDKDTLKQEISEHLKDSEFIGTRDVGIVASPITTIKLLNSFIMKYPERELTIDSHLVQFLIIFIQIQKNCMLFGYASSDGYNYPSERVFKERYMDTLNICQTYEIFPKYVAYVETKLRGLELKRTSIFDSISFPDNLRLLALAS